MWPGRRCCRAAELSAVIRMDGNLHLLGNSRFALHLTTENAAAARKCLRLISDLYKLSGKVTIRRSKLSKTNNYLVFVNWQSGLGQALNELGILDDSLNLRQDVPGRLIKRDCCALSYLRGLFLGGGFISDPKSQYHLEFTSDNLFLAQTISDLLKRFDLGSKHTERREHQIIYMKQAQTIFDFLSLIGANAALLKCEDVRILKSVRSSVNRVVNCDTANLNKVVEAALDQLSDIAKIDEAVGLHKLPLALREIAEARIANPQASLKELGEAGELGLTKSAAYHRVRRLKEFADKLVG